MRYGFILFIMAALAASCSDEAAPVRSDANGAEEKALYTNENISVVGKNPGLPEGARRLYLSLFSDLTTNTEALKFQENLDREIRANLQLMGFTLIDRIRSAQAVISGSIDLFTIDEAARITNIPALLYSFSITYNVTDPDRNYIQQDRHILEEVLVLDTNNILSNTAADYLILQAGNHAADAIVSGWQMAYSRTPTSIDMLGGTSNAICSNTTNWN
jgi:hypothetical protein